MAESIWYEKALECIDENDYAQAKIYFEKALTEGDTDAYNGLGYLYYVGLGVPQDYKQAFVLYQKGAKAGDANSIVTLGLCYELGHGIDRDLQKATYYYEKAAGMGVFVAMYKTGVKYQYGYGVGQNTEKALYWLEMAANEGYPRAFSTLGYLYYNGKLIEQDLQKSLAFFQKGVEAGDHWSRLAMSSFYEKGQFVTKDLEKAKSLAQEAYDSCKEKAIIEDDTDAQTRMGEFYFKGFPLIGIKQDYMQAAEWYEKAANHGDEGAQNNLGLMYRFGIGLIQSYEKALYWYSKAAASMNPNALDNLAGMYYHGYGVEQDYVKAAELYAKAANLGFANSQENLGEMYMKGLGVNQDYTKAVFWLEKSAKKGERSAFTPLANCYRKGLGVEKDVNKAFELLKKGAEMGDLQSKVSMAECLIEGWGTRCNFEHAFKILDTICHTEKEYREKHVTVNSFTSGNELFFEDPLDTVNLSHYAKAYYLLAILCYTGNGTKKDPSEAIRLLRTADKYGYVNEDASAEPLETLLERWKNASADEGIQDTVDCQVEIREKAQEKGERYDVVLLHADGTETIVNIMGRNKFIYILTLLITKKGKSIAGLTTKVFSCMRNELEELAERMKVRPTGGNYNQWIREFIYQEYREKEDGPLDKRYRFYTHKYSQALTDTNKCLNTSCSDEEYETFKLSSSRSQDSITTIPIEPSQIVVPESLYTFLDKIPTQDVLDKHPFKKIIKES